MKRNLLVYGIPFVLAVIIFLVIRFVFMGSYHFNNMDLKEYQKVVASNDKKVVFLVNTNDDTSKKAIEVLKKVFYGSNIKTYYLDIAKLSQEEFHTLLGENKIFEKGISTPLLALLNEGKVVDDIVGVFTEEEVVTFVQDNGLRK